MEVESCPSMPHDLYHHHDPSIRRAPRAYMGGAGPLAMETPYTGESPGVPYPVHPKPITDRRGLEDIKVDCQSLPNESHDNAQRDQAPCFT